eukprot:1005801-Pyramimonas_sp.AAC.1
MCILRKVCGFRRKVIQSHVDATAYKSSRVAGGRRKRKRRRRRAPGTPARTLKWHQWTRGLAPPQELYMNENEVLPVSHFRVRGQVGDDDYDDVDGGEACANSDGDGDDDDDGGA